MDRKKVTIPDLQAKKEAGQPITMLTAYDYPTALLVDRAGIDILLVGDSLGMVVLGMPNTVAVTMKDMIHHCKAVSRGASSCLIVGDLPFMSYNVSTEKAMENAGRLLKEGNADVVKLEGGREMAEVVRKLVDGGIPVQGHIGLTPQSATKLGGFKVQGKDVASARKLVDDAIALEQAGAFSLILEAVPDRLARIITETVKIPTIGIGAGPWCDGQVLVTHDMVGLFDRFTPKFVRKYANVYGEMMKAMESYKADVENRAFPGPEHGFTIKDEILDALKKELGQQQ